MADSYIKKEEIPDNFLNLLMQSIIDDLNQNNSIPTIAAKFHVTLIDYIARTAKKYNLYKIAFSGGVFQNALLVDMLFDLMDTKKFKLFFQNEFSPNDEGISFGQLIYANSMINNNRTKDLFEK
jgi:hydrogenase maturation protein HypF